MAKFEYDDNENLVNSLRGKVFNQLRSQILTGIYKPGDSLIELRLSEELGVSRTPIREAIRQLELEGLVHAIPNKGAVVKGVTEQDVEDIFTIRMRIEGLASRWAAEKITEEEIKELKEALEFEEFYTIKNDVEQLMKFDSKFHDIIFRASKSNPLMHMLSTFHHYIQSARNNSFHIPGRPDKVFDEHKAIFEAIRKKDADTAEQLTVAHIRNARNSYNEKHHKS
ncbi:DNA-binding GntR family transcriptional regulator [Ruminiclostridium sufflavum DSM 19573]|uniref:DNA-binding GntR family transcriptional regulator n=1 Tax=Ruminiclostridium sufflavum DSM 19573 TaxID=1121337 RepID=A0A318XMU8_9FIRM|nr:GntR family transcriptional regulator [Ruminiclostridium sufflavum]PYG88861.1 DNA-binding GntR family transcriptional regulator [Ruminiclostridium sufflavum DSM 19573]